MITSYTIEKKLIHILTIRQMMSSIKNVLEEIDDTLIAEGYNVSFA